MSDKAKASTKPPEKLGAEPDVEKDLISLGEALEEAAGENIYEEDISKWLEKQLAGGNPLRQAVLVKPKARTDAAEALRAMRERR